MQKSLNTKVRSKPTFLEHKNLCWSYNIALDLLTAVLKNKGKKKEAVCLKTQLYIFIGTTSSLVQASVTRKLGLKVIKKGE